MRVAGAERVYVRLKHLDPNPFRHIEHYPIRKLKVAALVRSIESNDWWENIEGRPAPGKPGRYEIAYGHHRLTALRELYKPDDEIRIMARDLTDAQMLRRMADENLELAGGDALVEIETLGAVIEAYAAKQISLDPPPAVTPRSQVKVVGVSDNLQYTAQSVAKFLDWVDSNGRPDDRCRIAFRAWHALQDRWLHRRALLQLADSEHRITRIAIDAALIAAEHAHKTAEIEARTVETAAATASPAVQERAQARATRVRTRGHARARKEASRAVSDVARGKKTATQVAAASRRRVQEQKQRAGLPIAEWVNRVIRDLKAIGKGDSFEPDLASIVRNADALSDDQLLRVADELANAAREVSKRWKGWEAKLRDLIRRERVRLALPEKGAR